MAVANTAKGGKDIRLISWNTKGLNKAVKIGKVLTQLRHLKGDVIFLQETHLETTNVQRIKRAWMSHVFHSKFSGKARGAAIIISKNTQFEPTKVIEDTNGRYVLVSGWLQSFPVILVSIYAPNWDNEQFFINLFAKIPNSDTHHILIGGDFNFVQDTVLDRSSPKQISLSKSAKVVRNCSSCLGISDPWRFRNPYSKVFSFFSPPHQNFSRIDFFLIDNKLLHLVTASNYHPIVISDHAPTSLDINLPSPTSPSLWKFSSHLLANQDFKNFVATQINNYMEYNDTTEMNSEFLWEALKTFVRGQIISFTSHLNKADRAKRQEILDELFKLDETYAASPSPVLYKKRLVLQSEYNCLMTHEVERQLRQTKQRFFEHGDKAGILLAQQARAASASRVIPRIISSSGNLTTDPAEINKIFLDFYTNLYTSEYSLNLTDIPNPLNSLNYPKISNDAAGKLGSPISPQEIQEAIKSMQNGKSPGPDGFTVEFYKAYSNLLTPVLVKMYNDSFQIGKLPATLYSASISLLLKKDKDPTSCASYRPISLLNVDFKILAKVLSLRLQDVMSSIISPDQTGFTYGRHSFFNTRRLLNILFSPSANTPEVIVSLDAEKAFDRVEWEYLFFALDKFGFDPKFISWIRLLYAVPTASIHTNGVRSQQFLLQRGTRQGCPLSPLLFNIAIEPLAIWLRSCDAFKGIIRHGQTHKLSLYADDLLLYISDPLVSLPPILRILDQFGHCSGYKLNFQKSELFFVNHLAKSLPTSSFPFKIALEGFKYLGISITNSFKDLFSNNFTPLLDKCKSDFARWKSLSLSLIGRVNLIKMIILPKFLYLFQHVPVYLNKSFFTNLDQQLNGFLWSNKPARIRKSVLQLSKSEGGLALPNFRHYFWACNIIKLLYWVDHKGCVTTPPWLHIEVSSSHSLPSNICSQLPIELHKISRNPVVTNTIKIWLQFRKQFGLHKASINMPILNNHLFPPSLLDRTFDIWANKGLCTLNDLYENDIFTSFSSLSTKFNLPNSHLFRFFQVRHFIQKLFPHFPNRPPESELDSILTLDPGQRRLISSIYYKISSLTPSPLNSLKQTWEQDLGFDISEDQWKDILDLIHSSSICARHALIQCKVLHRAHYTNAKLAKIFSNISDECNRCKHSPADHLHMFWSCPRLTDYWSDIFRTISQALNLTIAPDVLTVLFGLSPTSITSSTMRGVIAFTTLLARRAILLKWKHVSPPSYEDWAREVLHCIQLEKIRFSYKGSLSSFYKTWNPILSIIRQVNTSPGPSP